MHRVFVEADLDGSGEVDAIEVYAMVLMIYLRINSICRAKPPPKAYVMKLIEAHDANKTGGLCESQFQAMAVVLCSHIAVRVLAQALLTLSAPFVAAHVIDRLAGVPWVVSAASSLIPRFAESALATEGFASLLVAGLFLMLAVPFALAQADALLPWHL